MIWVKNRFPYAFCLFSLCLWSLHVGDNGTIDGQGDIWWKWFKTGNLNNTRPHLVELMNSTGVVISNLTFLNSPFWTIHPVYCRFVLFRRSQLHVASLFIGFNCFYCHFKTVQKWSVYEIGGELRLVFWMNSHVTVQNVTILAPHDSPNTDGIDPGEFYPLEQKIFLSIWMVDDRYSLWNCIFQTCSLV